MVSIFEKHLLITEIIDLSAFYKTSSGQKFINIQPDIQKKTLEIMMSKYMPEIVKAVEEGKN